MNKLIFAAAVRTHFGTERTLVIDEGGKREVMLPSDDGETPISYDGNIIFRHGFKKPGRLEVKVHEYKVCKNPKAEGRSSAKRDHRRDFRRNHNKHFLSIV